MTDDSRGGRLARVTVHFIARPSRDGGPPDLSWLDEILAAVDGFDIDRISIGDVQGTHLECFTGLGYIAARTKRVRVGPMVTTTASRDPGVLAAALASLDAISGGRAYAVMGRGDGVVNNLDLPPTTISRTREDLIAVRTLLREGGCQLRGRSIRLDWPDNPGERIPLGLAPGGPRMLRMASEVADEIFLATGVTPEDVEKDLVTIEEAAAAAGREDRPELWWVTRFGIGETFEEAAASAGEALSSMGNHALRGDYEGKRVPRELWPVLREYHERYDYGQKNPLRGFYTESGAAPRRGLTNVELMNELGLRDYFTERFAVVGTPDAVVERLRQLAGRGVDRLVLLADSLERLELIGREVLPRVKSVE